MIARRRWMVLGSTFGLYLLGVGLLGVITAGQSGFDIQAAISNWYGEGTALAAPAPNDAPWSADLQRVDEALAQQNISAAERAWHEAYSAALRSRRWEGLVEVGDAYLRIGEVAKGRKAAEPKARSLYLGALFRARQQRSLDGVLRVAEAFAALADHEVVEQCLKIAEQLAARDPKGQANLRLLRKGLAARRLEAKTKGPDLDPFPLLSHDETAGP